MRVTTQTKEKTRDRILREARKLFAGKGFEPTTTRDIAARAGIAVGTLFNYFPSKEALGLTLLAEALDDGNDNASLNGDGPTALEELLFGHIMAGLRAMEPYRNIVGPVIEAGMSPFSAAGTELGEHIRADRLEAVGEMIARNTTDTEPSLVVMHLYWTLYLGVLAFWSRDESPHQEETLAILDHSIRLFVSSVSTNNEPKEVSDGA